MQSLRTTSSIPAFLRTHSSTQTKLSFSRLTKNYMTHARIILWNQWKTILYTTSFVSITALLYTSCIRSYTATHNNHMITTNTVLPTPIHQYYTTAPINNHVAELIIPQLVKVKPVATHAHDSTAFTQGLQLINNIMYESTGMYGSSEVRMIDFITGNIMKQVKLDNSYFGEGLSVVPTHDHTDYNIYVLTWREHKCIVYDSQLNQLYEYTYAMDGWGLTYNHHTNKLMLSDGSDKLYIIDPYTFIVESTINCTQYDTRSKQYVPVYNINELEYINGYIYANIWLTPNIAVINSNTGIVHKYLQLDRSMRHDLNHQNRDAVSNGIAYDTINKKLYITGKMWPKLYEIDHIPE